MAEGALDSPDHEGVGFETGRNSFLRTAWLPPDPPPGHGVHRYAFQVFALKTDQPVDSSPGREALIEVLREHAIASGLLIGTYERPDGSIKLPKTARVATPTESSAPSVLPPLAT
ncbi:hypothetical protein BH09PSE6_BH09PSE6_02360 [soil metagenome]